MLRMVSILTVLLAVAASGCSDKTSEKPVPAAGQADRSAAKGLPAEPQQAPGEETESTSDSPMFAAKGSESEGRAAPAGAGPSPHTSSAAAARTEGPQISSPALDADMQTQVAKWLEQMASDAAVERRAGGEALSEQGEAAMPYIVQGLRHGTASQRRGAATYLIGRISPRDEVAVQALIEAMTAQDVELQRAALQAVERLPDETLPSALPALQTLAQNPPLGEAYRCRALRHCQVRSRG